MPRKSKKTIEPAADIAMEKGPKTIKVLKKNKLSPANIDENGALRIDELNLTRLLRFEAEIRAYGSNLQNEHLSLMNLTKQLDPQSLLVAKRNTIAALEQRREEYAQEYRALKKNIGDMLHIDFDKVSYNDVTGVIFQDPNPAEDAKAVKK